MRKLRNPYKDVLWRRQIDRTWMFLHGVGEETRGPAMAKQPKRPRLRSLPSRLRTLDMAIAHTQPREQRFYHSPEWRALVAQIKAERGERCEDCGAIGCRIVGDHIDEISDGGARLDPTNVRLRCLTCHGRKTAAAARARLGWV